MFGIEGHTATLYGDSIVVVGGKTAAFYLNESVLKLNLTLGEWQRIMCDGTPPLPRAYHSACLHESRLLIFGGITSIGLNDVHYNTYNVFTVADGLDRETQQQLGIDRLRDPSWLRPLLSKAFEPDGILYALDFSSTLPRWELLRCSGELPCNRSHHSAAVQGGAMFILGGYCVHKMSGVPDPAARLYRLDLNSLHWETIELNDSPLHRWGATVIPLGGPLLCLFGGVARSGNRETRDTFLIETQSGEVQQLPASDNTPLPRAGHIAWRWGGDIFIMGGTGGIATRFFADLHRLNIPRRRWDSFSLSSSSSIINNTPPALTGSAAVVVGEFIFLIGGLRANLMRSAEVFRLSMRSLTWARVEVSFVRNSLRLPSTLSRITVSRGVQTELGNVTKLNSIPSEAFDPYNLTPSRSTQQEKEKNKKEENEEENLKESPKDRWAKEISELSALSADWSKVISNLYSIDKRVT